MLPDILIGLVLILVILALVYVVRHPAVLRLPTGQDMATSIVTGVRQEIDDALKSIPEIVSDEVYRLKADLSDALARAQKLEADLAARQAIDAGLAAVRDQITATIPAPPVMPQNVVPNAIMGGGGTGAAPSAETTAEPVPVAVSIPPAQDITQGA